MKHFIFSYLKSIFVISIFIATLIIISNYKLDYYGVFLSRKTFIGVEPNQHSLKIKHLIDNPIKSKTLLFSDSRGGVIDVNVFSGAAYNLSYSMGVSNEFLEDLLFLDASGVTPENIMVFLDYNELFYDHQYHKNEALRKFIDFNNKDYFYEYLFMLPDINKLKRVLDFDLFKDKKNKYLTFDIKGDGQYIENNFNYCKSFEFSPINNYSDVKLNLNLVEEKINILKKIKFFCRSKNIKLNFFSHPISSKDLKDHKNKVLSFYKFIDLAKSKNIIIEKIWDDAIIYKSCNWRDKYHYNREVAKVLEEKVLKSLHP